jgi:DNA-binding CsgD family transcriptional regulator
VTTGKTSDKNNSDNAKLKEAFETIISILKEQGLSSQELLDMYYGPKPDKRFVPIAIFAGKLSPSESLCKYMKENLSLSYKEISELLNRDERSIWTSCKRADQKMPKKFSIPTDSLLVPVNIFADRKLSILENLVMYLREQTGQTNYRIALLLNKTPSMVYVIYNRASSKLPKKKVQTKRLKTSEQKS